MSRIHIVSASAGSGKTYRLAELLEQEVVAGRARPDAIVATTFTRDAAAELMTRVRRRFVEHGLQNEALLLEAARIGTVHGVCGRFVETATFELGLPPDLQVLDEVVARTTFREVLSGLMTPELRRELEALEHRMVEFHWSEVIPELVALARANHIGPEALREQGRASIESFAALFEPSGDHEAIVRDAIDACQTFLREAPLREDLTKATREALGEVRRAAFTLERGRDLPWKDWCRLAKIGAGKKCRDLAEAVARAAHRHACSSRLWSDARRAIELAFELAAQAFAAYQEHKRASGVLDFTDQEVFALQALRRDDVRERLRGTIDLVLVDEFQDTSPLQLAIFTELASLAERSVWVGDQKQAIYGFRGTDPELMDAAIRAILGDQAPETLTRSWRSRPALVELTSDAFAPPFAAQGVPESRVRLVAADSGDTTILGPVLEAWLLGAKSRDEDAHAVADGVRQLLADDAVHVRDTTGEVPVRRVRTSDVAVLCRTNEACRAVADALERRGLRAALPRAGLFCTHEARACFAGLRLLCDPADTLARAELVRLTTSTEVDLWLEEALLAAPGDAFRDHPLVARLGALAAAHPHVGAVTALDLVMDAIEVDELCLRWGDAERRAANLDALRAHAVVFRDTALATGSAASPAALVVAFEHLAREEHDARAVEAEGEVVTVSTWHAAKGREWPITVLADLRTSPPRTLGLRAYTVPGAFRFDDPLASRVLRYWPNPYHAQNNGMSFHERLEAHPEHARSLHLHAAEDLRLFYVGWTRARDRLIVAGRAEVFARASVLDCLRPSHFDPAAQVFRTATSEVPIRVRSITPQDECVPIEGTATVGPMRRERVDYPPATRAASEIEVEGDVVRTVRLGSRLNVGEGADRAELGLAIHGFLAADRPTLEEPRRFQLATDLLQRWELPRTTPPVSLLEMSDRLLHWLRTQWSIVSLHREVPVTHRLVNGTLVTGIADLLVETTSGWVIVDHKTHVTASFDELEDYAATVTGQLEALAGALRTLGHPVVALLVHFPRMGYVVEVAATAWRDASVPAIDSVKK